MRLYVPEWFSEETHIQLNPGLGRNSSVSSSAKVPEFTPSSGLLAQPGIPLECASLLEANPRTQSNCSRMQYLSTRSDTDTWYNNHFTSSILCLRLWQAKIITDIEIPLIGQPYSLYSSNSLEGLALLITSPQHGDRGKKEGQCKASVRFISVSCDPDTVRNGWCACES